jgi:simple sugar transport system permease protein
LVIGAFLLLAVGANPFSAYGALLDGAIGSKNSIADTLVKATPLLFVSVGICIAFRAGVINIGGEGQFIMGAIAATLVALNLDGLPGPAIMVLAALAGAIGGAVWGGLAGLLKARLGVNEILSTVMLNVIAALLMNYLVAGPLIDPRQIEAGTRIPETARFPRKADLPRLWEPTRLHLGIVIAIAMAVVVWVVLWRTPFGFKIRAVGFNPSASRYAGMSVARNAMMALTLSGMLAGMGGAIQVMGLDHRLYSEGNAAAFTGLAGFNGIVVALFGGLHPLGAVPASMLFGGLVVGANALQRTAQVPSSIATTLNGIVVLVVVSSQFWLLRRQRRLNLPQASEAAATEEPPPDETAEMILAGADPRPVERAGATGQSHASVKAAGLEEGNA